MSVQAIKMPDVGEGIAEAELVEWMVNPGDFVREDDIIAAVMTDKATVEIPSAISGTVVWLGGEIGESISIGADLVRIEVDGEGNSVAIAATDMASTAHPDGQQETRRVEEASVPVSRLDEKSPAALSPGPKAQTMAPARNSQAGSAPKQVLAAPSVRRRARDAGVDLRRVHGTGPAGRIIHDDLDAYLANGESAPVTRDGMVRKTGVEEIRIVGLRRKIAERMTLANSHIPHITIVEEVDVTALEDLRGRLNKDHAGERGKLTVLPFLMRAMVRAVGEQPHLNALFDDEAGIMRQHAGVHIGIATQTPSGLMVPVVHHSEARSLWDCAAEIMRLSEAARNGSAKREELTGSTISITSLGPLGALATTPIINRPEVAIVGVNRMAVRPFWSGEQFVPRKMMNISCSFDHRVIDGWDAAVFVQRIKALLETPAMIFVEA